MKWLSTIILVIVMASAAPAGLRTAQAASLNALERTQTGQRITALLSSAGSKVIDIASIGRLANSTSVVLECSTATRSRWIGAKRAL
jgi:hypothetical protein